MNLQHHQHKQYAFRGEACFCLVGHHAMQLVEAALSVRIIPWHTGLRHVSRNEPAAPPAQAV
jgi:hypothetical protein